MKSLWKTALAAVTAVALLAGCSLGGGSAKEEEPTTFKVMYYDEAGFFQEYGMLFSALYPNIDIEVISTRTMYREEVTDYEKAFDDFIEEQKPDLIMLSSDQYEKYAKDGKLLNLSTYMEKDKYDAEGLVPGMVDFLKELGGGQLYGLTPTFYSQALLYNKSLFDKYNVPYPTDKMTWDQVFQLARQFPTEGEPKDRVFGLKLGWSDDLFDLTNTLALTQGLSYVNVEKKQMTITSDSWKKLIQTADDLIKSDALFFESKYMDDSSFSGSYEDYLMRDPFISGRLAMTIGETYTISQIKEAKDYLKDSEQIISDWDIVTAPVSQQYPDATSFINFHTIFAITEDSPNKEAAWKFLSYITGEEYSRVKSKTGFNNGFPVRSKYIQNEDGKNYAAFFALKPMTVNMYKDHDKLPQAFQYGQYSLFSEELNKFKDGTITLDEALANIQLRGDELLQQADPPEGEGEVSIMPLPEVVVEGSTESSEDAPAEDSESAKPEE